MNHKKQEDGRQLKLDFRVRLEPALELTAGNYDAAQCEQAARVFYRWSKQLWVKARVLRSGPPSPPLRPRLPRPHAPHLN